MTEFEDCPETLRCRAQLEQELLEKTDLQPANCRFLPAESPEEYEAAIAAAGGLDLAVLGLGDNAHFGFNEPATPYDSRTHRQKLTPATRRQLAEHFGSEEAVPAFAWTMGVKTLVEARQILVLAFGEEKAGPAFQMSMPGTTALYPRPFCSCP